MAKMFDKVSESFLDAIKSVTEKKLTPAEMKKREEVAKAIERDNPDMPMDKKMAIATATAKKVAEAKLDPVDHKALKGSHADRKDKDIDNDGDVDTSDEYLHNRRKAVKKAMAKKMKESIEESAEDEHFAKQSQKMQDAINRHLRRGKDYKTAVKHAQQHVNEDAEQLDEILPVIAGAAGRALATRAVGAGASAMTKRVAGAAGSYAGKKLADKATSTNMAKEEAEQIDEISAGMKARYKTKARGDLEAAQSFKSDLEHEGEPKTSRVSKDVNRIIKNRKMGMKRANEEAEQIDELSKKTLGSYVNKAKDRIDTTSWRQGYREGSGRNPAGPLEKKLSKRHKGIETAVNKLAKEEAELTPEEIAMIEAKMAGVADDALPGNEHMCATKVFHKEWKEGTPVPTMHADPDDEGLIEWYDVMFDHGIERVMTEDMEIVSEMSHGHKKRGMKKEDVEQIDEISADMAYRYLRGRRKRDYDISPDGKSSKSKKSMTYAQMIKRGKSSTRALRTIEKEKKGILNREEAEQIDELSLDTLGNYMDKASDARGHRGLSTKKIDNRYKGVALAQKKGDKQAAKMQGKLKPVKTDYERQMDDSHRHIYGEEADVPFKGPYKKTGERKDEYGNTVKNVAKHLAKKAMKKQMGEENEITEARGRPKKTGQMDYTVHPKTKEKMMHNNPAHMKRIENLYRTGALKRPKTEAGQNIVTQLRKASISMRGGETVNFTYGTAKHVSAAHAQKLLDKHAGMKPAEKEAFQKKIGHSHEEMKKHV